MEVLFNPLVRGGIGGVVRDWNRNVVRNWDTCQRGVSDSSIWRERERERIQCLMFLWAHFLS